MKIDETKSKDLEILLRLLLTKLDGIETRLSFLEKVSHKQATLSEIFKIQPLSDMFADKDFWKKNTKALC